MAATTHVPWHVSSASMHGSTWPSQQLSCSECSGYTMPSGLAVRLESEISPSIAPEQETQVIKKTAECRQAGDYRAVVGTQEWQGTLAEQQCV